MNQSNLAVRPHPAPLQLIIIGVAVGLLSGLFGIGGGTVIVPALVIWLGFDQRLAAGISVTAILPTSIVGTTSYALNGNIDWVAAIALAVGVVGGAQVGGILLHKLRIGIIQWSFLIFLIVVIVSLWFVVPQREDSIQISAILVVALLGVGFITGILSGLLGVGGGIIIVPVLMFFFGASDLIAKGTSLLMMVPGSFSATLANYKRKNLDWRTAIYIGVAAAITIPFGTIFAGLIDPFWGNVAFSIYIFIVFLQMLIRKLRTKA